MNRSDPHSFPFLVHKDLKLENVVLDDDKQGNRATLKIIDFDTVEELQLMSPFEGLLRFLTLGLHFGMAVD